MNIVEETRWTQDEWNAFIEEAVATWSSTDVRAGVEGQCHTAFWMAVVLHEVFKRTLTQKGDMQLRYARVLSMILWEWSVFVLNKKADSGRYTVGESEHMREVAGVATGPLAKRKPV